MHTADNNQSYFPMPCRSAASPGKASCPGRAAPRHPRKRQATHHVLPRSGSATCRRGSPVTAGELNLYAIQLKIQRHVIGTYLDRQCPEILPQLLAESGISPGSDGLADWPPRFLPSLPRGAVFSINPELDPVAWISAAESSADRARAAGRGDPPPAVAAENRALDGFRRFSTGRTAADQRLFHCRRGSGEPAGRRTPCCRLGAPLPRFSAFPEGRPRLPL